MPKLAKPLARGIDAKRANAEAIGAFCELANALSAAAPIGKMAYLNNITFWCGAGFAKAWEPTSPVGAELFNLEAADFIDKYALGGLERILGVDTLEGMSGDDMRRVNYFLDMNEKYPDIRSRYIDGQNVSILRGYIRASIQKRFSKISKLNHTPDDSLKFPIAAGGTEETIREFFHRLFLKGHGDAFAQGVRYNFITTNYDFILDALLDPLDPDDSVHLYAYRGFSPHRINGDLNPNPLHDHWLVHNLIKPEWRLRDLGE